MKLRSALLSCFLPPTWRRLGRCCVQPALKARHPLFFLTGLLLLALPFSCTEGEHMKKEPPGTAGPSRLFSEVQAGLQVVAPEFISTGMYERDTALSADGRELYFTVLSGRQGTIMVSRYLERGWSRPEVAPFSGRFSDMEPALAAGGHSLFFASNRPVSGSQAGDANFDIWRVDRTGKGWSEPVHLPAAINSAGNEFYPSVASSGNLYFTAQRKNGRGSEDIYRASWNGSGYQEPQLLGAGVNSPADEFNAFVAPDESFILYTAWGRKDGGPGRGDLYLSPAAADGSYPKGYLLPEPLNSPALDYCPFLSPDGRWLFFSSERLQKGAPGPRTYQQLMEAARRSGNGRGDLYVFPFAKLLEMLPEQARPLRK